MSSPGGSSPRNRQPGAGPSSRGPSSRSPSNQSCSSGDRQLRGGQAASPRRKSCSGNRKEYHDVGERVEARLGLAQISGRYHKRWRTLETDYNVTEVALGSGCNGVVRLAESKTCSSHKFAVKEFNFSGVPLSKREQLENEVEVFLSMDHPHIARLLDVYEYEEHIALVMEYMKGMDLFDRLSQMKRYPEHKAAHLAMQMLLALNYIHSHGIMHGDVKLENWMFDCENVDHLKLIDFGFSKMCENNGVAIYQNGKKLSGTLGYIAPEAIDMNTSSQNDQWSLGVVVFVLLCGYMPFSGSKRDQLQKIQAGKYIMRPEQWNMISEDARLFTRGLLNLCPEERMTAQKSLDHPFIAKCRQKEKQVDASIVEELRDFSKQSRFRRVVLMMIAWSLSSDEMAKVEEYFLAMDTNHHGTITYQELKKVMIDNNCSNVDVKKAFEALDTHHDQEIHYSDFLAAMVSKRIGINDEHLFEAFRKFDTHDAGIITLEDLREVLGDRVDGERVESFLHEVDPLDRGYITYHEFSSYVTGRPLHWHGDEIATTAYVHGDFICGKKASNLPAWVPDGFRRQFSNSSTTSRPGHTWHVKKTTDAPACCTLQ
eukprot:TRINITY_DN21720_c0_g1_i1.p1 TRINITY_DN21720_c0_g1~~TRINITY_DN21720_c0_g1_i1.p1  ORF type:complete len:598 (-),score=126.18 TRINITY_DN21720_c0_g1_i1:258-2051(-)